MNPRTKREKAIYHAGFIQGYSFGYVLGRAPELVDEIKAVGDQFSKTINAAIGRSPDCGEVTDHRPDCPSIRRSRK